MAEDGTNKDESLKAIQAQMKAMEIKSAEETQKDMETEYYKLHGYDTQEKYTGEQVGFAFLREFIKVYKGSTVDIIPDEARAKMVKSINNYEEIVAYQKYRDIYWHFLVLTSDREEAATNARYWYLKLKMAIADGDTLKEDETDDFGAYSFWCDVEKITNNHEKIKGVYERYCRALYVCRRLEILMEIIAQAVGIDDFPYRGLELFNTYLEEANKLINLNKNLPVEPIEKKDFELGNEVIESEDMLWAGEWINRKERVMQLALSIADNPAIVHEIRDLLILDI